MKNRKNKNYANSYRLKRSNKHDCRRSYNTIFTNECVNIDGIKGGKSDYDNFVNIDKAVEYIKQSDNLDKENYLNRVKAVKKDYENDFKDSVSKGSPYAYIGLLLSFVNILDRMLSDEFELTFNILIVFACIIVLVILFFVNIKKKNNDQKAVKYLTYLEQQLESDK